MFCGSYTKIMKGAGNMSSNYNFYAVKRGREPGIYDNWDECRRNVQGFPRSFYKGFKTQEEAQEFLDDESLTGDDTKENETKLMRLIRLAKGERTAKSYAEESGVSASNISRLINGSITSVSPAIAQKLTSYSAQPRNGVTYNDLMQVLGYITEEHDASWEQEFRKRHEQFGEKQTDISWKIFGIKEAGQSEDSVERLYYEKQRFDNIATGIIYKSLSENKISFSPAVLLEEEMVINEVNLGPHFDMNIQLNNSTISKWSFIFCNNYFELEKDKFVSNTLQSLLFDKLDSEKKVSIITNDQMVANNLVYIAEKQKRFCYKGELSVILLNTDTMAIEEEIYLASYDDRDRKVFLSGLVFL